MQIAVIPAKSEEPIRFEDVPSITLDVLYTGTKAETVEHVGLSREGQEASAFLDEDGKVNGREVNPRADWLLHMFGPGLAAADTIVGDVVICGGADDEGESTGLTEEWIAFLRDGVPATAGQAETA